jgi:hypothetical protein
MLIILYREQGQLSRDGATAILTLAYSWEGKFYELHNNSQILYPIAYYYVFSVYFTL